MTIKDPHRVAALFDVVEKQAKGHPGFVHIGSEASAELREINEHIRKKHEEEKHQRITPAPVEGGSQPTEAEVDAKTPVPPVDKTPQEQADARARKKQEGAPVPSPTARAFPSSSLAESNPTPRPYRDTYDGVPGPAEPLPEPPLPDETVDADAPQDLPFPAITRRPS